MDGCCRLLDHIAHMTQKILPVEYLLKQLWGPVLQVITKTVRRDYMHLLIEAAFALIHHNLEQQCLEAFDSLCKHLAETLNPTNMHANNNHDYGDGNGASASTLLLQASQLDKHTQPIKLAKTGRKSPVLCQLAW